VEAVIGVNDTRPEKMVDKIVKSMGGSLDGKTICLLGLTFKPNTDDLRESPAMIILDKMLEAGAKVRVYDPVATEIVARSARSNVTYCSDEYEAADGAEALVLATEWNQFRGLDLDRLKGLLRRPLFIDLRNVYKPELAKEKGFDYESVGR
jgi:UDPglucose 6-dehydrogenase